MNLDFLRSQFAEVSKRHPGLSLIKLLANKDDSHPRITTVEKRGAFPSLHGKFAHRDEFPFWNLSGAVDCDFWALWLDRDTVYSREENKRCLHEYSTVFSLTSELVKELTRKPDCPSWIREQRDLGFYSDGTPYFGAGQWLSLVSNRLTDTTAMYFPLGSSSTAIVVRDIGLESILFLDSITNGEQGVKTDSKPVAASTSVMIIREAARKDDLAHFRRMKEQNDAEEQALTEGRAAKGTVKPVNEFELAYDAAVKLNPNAQRSTIAESIYRGLSPRRKSELVDDWGSKDGAIKNLKKSIDNLRAKRKREAKHL